MPYQDLLTYQQATIIFDFTEEFCQLYLSGYEHIRRRQQMTEAGRSGKQNIVEGTAFSKTSKKSEIKLINVARASLEELLEDYKDFLRQRNLPMWEKDSLGVRKIRELGYRQDKTYLTYKPYLKNATIAANVIICLINQTNYLLDKQINVLEKEFLSKGGYTENLYKRRKNARGY